jgi:hypothetical protein
MQALLSIVGVYAVAEILALVCENGFEYPTRHGGEFEYLTSV